MKFLIAMVAGEVLSIPTLGLVPPAKEVSSVSENDKEESDLFKIIQLWPPDSENFFIAVYHHVILSEQERIHSQPAQGESRYTAATSFPDAISFLTQLAKIKTRSQLFTAVMVAPQVPTAMLAQQTAAIANASHGRFRLGVGVGWNKSEYEALGLGPRFHHRGRFLNEQIPALEMMLTGRPVNLNIGNEEKISGMAINPKSNYPVPIWVGGQKDAALERAAIYGEGWMPLGDIGPFMEQKPRLLRFLEINQRGPDKFGMMGRITLGTKTTSEAVDDLLAWIKAGATHLALTTTGQHNPDWRHHSHLLHQFLEATAWLRRPDSSLSDLVTEGAFLAPENILMTGTKKFCGKLKIELRHFEKFLTIQGFVPCNENLNQLIDLPMLAKNSLKVVQAWQKSPGQIVWVLQPQGDKLTETMIVYDAELELSHSHKLE